MHKECVHVASRSLVKDKGHLSDTEIFLT